MITEDKDIKVFCIINEFNKNFNAELDKKCFTLTAYVIVTAKVRYTNYSQSGAFPMEHWRVKFTKTLVYIILFWRTLYIYKVSPFNSKFFISKGIRVSSSALMPSDSVNSEEYSHHNILLKLTI